MAISVWTLCGLWILGIGIWCLCSKKPVAFFQRKKPLIIADVKGYNRACGSLWVGYSLILLALGLPLLTGRLALILAISVLGLLLDTLGLVLIYEKKILPRYQVRR